MIEDTRELQCSAEDYLPLRATDARCSRCCDTKSKPEALSNSMMLSMSTGWICPSHSKLYPFLVRIFAVIASIFTGGMKLFICICLVNDVFYLTQLSLRHLWHALALLCLSAHDSAAVVVRLTLEFAWKKYYFTIDFSSLLLYR